MKKIIVTLAVVVLAAPAMGTVTITCTPGVEADTVVVSFTSDEGQPVRAIAVDIQLNDPNVWIADVNCVSAGYFIYPGSINIDTGGNVTDYGTCAGVLDGNMMSSEQGSAYVGETNEPAQSGDLFIITLDGCVNDESGEVSVTVSENAHRGGVVMEDPNATPIVNLNGCIVNVVNVEQCEENPCCCLGDANHDCWIGVADLFICMGRLGQKGAPFQIPEGDPFFEPCCDIVYDNWIMVPDYFMLLGMLGNAGPPYAIPCP